MTHTNTRRRLALLAAAALVGAAFAVTPVAAQGDPNVCDGVIDGAPLTLDMTMHTGSNPGAEMATVEAFNAGPGAELGVTVNVIAIGEQAYETAITSAAAAGEMPDLVDMDGPTLYPFAFNGLLRPITSCASDEKLGTFLQSIIEQGTYNGELYSLGSFESGMGLWAHKSMLEAVGARIPTGIDDAWTAEEFDKILRDLQAAGYGANGPLDIKWHYPAGEWRAYGFAPMIQSAGGDLIDRSTMKSSSGVINGPETVGAMTQFQTWVQDGLVDLIAEDDNNVTVGPDGAANTGDETPLSWVGHWMHSLYSENLGDDLILLPLPDFGNGSKGGMGSWNWAVSSGADGIPASGDEVDLDAAWAFVDYATQAEAIERFVNGYGAVPPTKDLTAFPGFQPDGDRALYIDYLMNAHSDPHLKQAGSLARPATAAYLFIRDRWSEAFADIVAGADVQSTLDNIAQQIDQEIEDVGY
jgi:multiple sugar transport system substrate-binding protein